MTPDAANPNPFLLVENCRYGRFLVPPSDIYVGQALIQYGEYSQIELDLLLQFLSPETRVVVVGANIGSLVVPLAQHAGEIVAFEPQRWIFHLMVANAALNGCINVRPYWAGLGDAARYAQVPVFDPVHRNNFGAFELDAGASVGGEPVPVYRLDKLPNMEMGLLTIDVEGMELDVLRGAEETIERCRPIIFFEADRKLKNPDVFAWLRAHKYNLHWYRTPLYNVNNWRKDPENVYMIDGAIVCAHNVVATPKERTIKLEGFLPVLEI